MHKSSADVKNHTHDADYINEVDIAACINVSNGEIEIICANKTEDITVKEGSVDKITYKSSNKKIATVSSTGKIKAKKAGKVLSDMKDRADAVDMK